MTTTKERMAAEELSDQTIRAAERAEIAGRSAPPTPAAPVYTVEYGVKHRFIQALRDCNGDGYRIPWALIQEAKAKLTGDLDSETSRLARGIADIIIINATWNKLCRELTMVHCTKRLAELKAEAKVAAEKQIADAVTAKAHSGRFVKRT